MKMKLESTLHARALKEKLERDGWRVDEASDGTMLASNADVISQPDARLHLHQMGLLTSSKVHIEFLVSPSAHPTQAVRRPDDAAAST
jgi:hypothetical protein